MANKQTVADFMGESLTSAAPSLAKSIIPRLPLMRIHLINPSDVSFGVAVITPRWLYVLAAATPAQYGDPHIVDETLEQLDFDTYRRRRRGRHRHPYAERACAATKSAARRARAARTWSTAAFTPRCIPDEAFEHGGAHAVVKGDGDRMWAAVI